VTAPRRPSLPNQTQTPNEFGGLAEGTRQPGKGGAAGSHRAHQPISPLPPRSASHQSAESCLLRALRAKNSEEKELFAHRGLSQTGSDLEMKALLLRQLYLVHLDRSEYAQALALAEEIIDTGELGDIARQDAARAALGLGQADVAAEHLRIAAAICPVDRRAFHWGTLGALLRFEGRPTEAVEAFGRASRCATKDAPLYRAQLVLAEREARVQPSSDLQTLRQNLESAESGRGYKLWVLGEICALIGDREASRKYLTHFLSRTSNASPAKSLALRGEIAWAQTLLQRLSA